MRPLTLQTLTWVTVTAAIGSALWLAEVESEAPELRKGPAGAAALQLPKEPTAAGPLRRRASEGRPEGRPSRPDR